MLEALRSSGTGALGAGLGWVTGQAGSIFLIFTSSWEIRLRHQDGNNYTTETLEKREKKDINRTLVNHLMKNGGCEDLVAAAPRQPQLVKQGPHLSGLCDLLRGFRLKILVYCFAFHPTINFGLVSLRPVLTKRGKYILGWNQDFKVVSFYNYPPRITFSETCWKMWAKLETRLVLNISL